MRGGFLLGNRNLLLVWLGQCLSQAGTRMYQISLAWWIVSGGTESAGLKMGGLLVAASLPGLLLVRPIGALVERRAPKRLLLEADGAAFAVAGAVGALALAGSLSLPVIYAAGFALSLCQAVIDPTLNKAVARLAPPDQLERAVSWISSTQSLAALLGAVFGAVSVEWLGLSGAIWANAASYGVALLCTAAISLAGAAPGAPAAASAPEAASAGTWRSLPALVRSLLLSFGVMNFFMTPTLVIIPVYVSRVLKGNASVLALVEAALWLGLVAGTLGAERLRTPGQGALLRAGSRLFVAAGAALAVAAMDVWTPYYALCVAGFGLALGMGNVKFLTLFQHLVPEAQKGRFFALLGAVTGFTFPVAFLVFGWLADVMSAVAITVVQGAGIVAVGLYALGRVSDAARDGAPEAAPLVEPVLGDLWEGGVAPGLTTAATATASEREA